jgi:hypothetical protein
MLKTMKAAGLNWNRLHDSFNQGTCWAYLEPQKGEWTFSDKRVMEYRQANIKLLGFLGTAPEWASFFDGKRHRFDYFNKTYQPKDIEAFKNYVRVVASRYKGIIDEYQFQNEPYADKFWHKSYDPKTGIFGMGKTAPEDYAKLSIIAYKELKKVYPEAVMYGFNTTRASHKVKKWKWNERVFKAGAYPYCDMIDYHFYNHAPSDPCLVPGDLVEKAREDSADFIKDHAPAPMKPMVMSEGNPTRGGSVPAGLRGKYEYSGLMKYSMPWTPSDQPSKFADLTCRFVISHLAAGVKRIFLYSDHTYHHMLHPGSFLVLLGLDGYPHPTLAAFSNMAWLLEDRQFAKRIPVGDQVWAYLFTGRDKTIAVISGKLNGTYTIAQNSELEVLGLYGNRLKGEVRYDNQLLYVSSALSTDELAKLLSSSTD